MRKVLFYVTLIVLMTAQLLNSAEINKSKKSNNNVSMKSSSSVTKNGKSRSDIPQWPTKEFLKKMEFQ